MVFTRILIFGGVGFIGANLVKRLAGKGYEIFVAHRGLRDAYRERLGRIIAENASLIEYRDPREAFEASKPEAIYNLVGEFFGSDREIIEANLGFVERLCSILKNYEGLFIHISAATVVGPRGDTIYEEESHLKGISPANIFDISKAEAERVIASNIRRWVIVRPTLVYGAYNAHPEWVRLVSMIMRGIAPLIRARISAIEVSELSEILLRAMELEKEYFFATECEPYNFNDFIDAMARALGRNPLKIPTPLWLARALAPKEIRRHMVFLNRVFSCDKMANLTGYRPRRRLYEGFEEMVKWILETSNIRRRKS
ncbi:MAG: NAD(P)-dependent oxidoreductase [Sulfolobales archaeon]